MKKKFFLITGSNGRFASILKKKFRDKKNFIFLDKRQLNILDKMKIRKAILRYKPYAIIHLAALSRPMIIHEKNIDHSISTNIIGTCNIVTECQKKNIKVIYFSTQYVYPGTKGNYLETSPLLPMNNYAWSKLGGECAVHMYKNSLILRVNMSENPWIHKFAFTNIKTNFLYHDEVADILPKLLLKKGIINVGSKNDSIFKFAKRTNINVKKSKYIYLSGQPILPKNSSMNIEKMLRILKSK
jgi:dTDP-4-dehydrorhamnose reductase